MKIWQRLGAPWTRRPAAPPPIPKDLNAGDLIDAAVRRGCEEFARDTRGTFARSLEGISGAFGGAFSGGVGIGGGLGAQQQYRPFGQQQAGFDPRGPLGGVQREAENNRLRVELANARNEIERLKKILEEKTVSEDLTGREMVDWTEDG
jgi:hypothetical protein